MYHTIRNSLSYQAHPTMIILQYLLQTGIVVVFALFFIPVIHQILFEGGYTFSVPFIESLIDQLWTWAVIFFIAGMAGNTIWFLRALQTYQASLRTF